MSGNIVLMEFEGNPNIGIYMFVNNKVCLLGKKVSEAKKKEIQDVLGVPVYFVTALETELVGIFFTGDDHFLVVPELFDHEKKLLQEICSEQDMELVELNFRLNTLGNNLCFGSEIIMINPEYPSSVIKKLEKKTGYAVTQVDNDNFKAIGSVCIYANGKYFISQEFEEEQVSFILDEIGGVGTINSGSNYISSGIVANNRGVIIGSASSTVEIQNVVEGLEYLG